MLHIFGSRPSHPNRVPRLGCHILPAVFCCPIGDFSHPRAKDGAQVSECRGVGTYNNAVLLMTAKAGAPLKAVPPMGRCEEVWGPAWREALQLPRSRMGIVSHAVKMDGLPTFGIISHCDWSEELSALVSTYGRPLCDFARMDMDAAVAVAAEDVQSAALAVRAALLDGDTTNAGLLAEAQAAVQNRYPFLLASFCRCNQVLPLRMSIFGSMGSTRKQGAAGVDYVRG